MTFGSILAQTFTTTPRFSPTRDLPSLASKVALVTGASTGLGKETALQLANKGAHVFCLGRTAEKTQAAIDDIIKQSGNNMVEFIQADLMDLDSVERAAEAFIARKLPLHILVNNAGIMATPFELSKQGIESQFATNHFAHFLLTMKLLPIIESSQPSRIVNLSSMAHLRAPKEGIKFDLLNDKDSYSPGIRYGGLGYPYKETKLANILFTKELQKRLDAKHGADCKIFVNAVHPGIVKTELSRNLAEDTPFVLGLFLGATSIDAKKGALTQIYAAAADDIEKQSLKGKYLVPYCSVADPNALGQNEDLAKKTWKWTEEIIGRVFQV